MPYVLSISIQLFMQRAVMWMRFVQNPWHHKDPSRIFFSGRPLIHRPKIELMCYNRTGATPISIMSCPPYWSLKLILSAALSHSTLTRSSRFFRNEPSWRHCRTAYVAVQVSTLKRKDRNDLPAEHHSSSTGPMTAHRSPLRRTPGTSPHLTLSLFVPLKKDVNSPATPHLPTTADT
jgi:hypothetical protein